MNIAAMIEPEIADKSALAIRNNIAQVESALSEFDKISAGLADLAARYPVDLVYDVTTSKGMAEAIAHRAAWRDPRINVEKFRKTAKAPVLALGKDVDARAAWLTEQLLVGETPVDEQIKAEERRKEELKQAKINAEFGRVQAIQEALAEIHMEVTAMSGRPAAAIADALARLSAWEPTLAIFQEQLGQAGAAKTNALAKLELMHKAALHAEAETAKLAAERTELALLRKAAAEQKAKDDAAAAEAAATERRAAQAERARLDAEAAVARKQAQFEHEAKMRAERKALAEQTRLAAEKAAKEQAKKAKAEAAQKKMRDAAQTMFTALVEIRKIGDETICLLADPAIKAAT